MHNLKDSNQLELDFERICILYENVNFAHFGTTLAVVFLYFMVREYSSPDVAITWAGLMVLAYLPRIFLSIIFAGRLKNKKITQTNIRPWEHYVTLSTVLPYICLVSVIFLPYGDKQFIATAICGVVFMSMATGGAMALSTSLGAILLYINLAMLSIIVKCFWLDNHISILLGYLLFIGYFLITRLIIRQHKTLVENIALKIENNQFALIDPLTKLWNRRRLDLHIEKLVPASIRNGEPFSVIMIDIDHFKEFNDTNGHKAGDELLIKIADLLLDCSRDQDLVVRYGGEEFIVLLPQTAIKNAAVITDRIRRNIKEKTEVTISAGVAEFSDDVDFDQLVNKADRALYTAKENGRDRYVLANA